MSVYRTPWLPSAVLFATTLLPPLASDHAADLVLAGNGRCDYQVGVVGASEGYHPTSDAVGYKCLFNHELLIVCSNKQNGPPYIQAFIEKLRDTDVDAILCCPTMWRTNLFPSEVDPQWKKYRPDQPMSKFPSYDYIMRYLHSGGDPVKDTLQACRKCKKDFFISYRMNDHHYVTDLTWPSHNAFWREHPEYWLGDSETSPYTKRDNIRLFNYLHPAVREYWTANRLKTAPVKSEADARRR